MRDGKFLSRERERGRELNEKVESGGGGGGRRSRHNTEGDVAKRLCMMERVYVLEFFSHQVRERRMIVAEDGERALEE